MEEAYYIPVHTSDFPLQDHLAATGLQNPTQELERPSSSSAADRALLNTQQSFNLRDSTISEKHTNHSKGTKTTGTVWVFTWSEVVNYVLQTVGLIAAVVFGVWAIRTYHAARNSLAIASTANELSSRAVMLAAAANMLSSQALAQNMVANSLAVLTFCASIQADPSSNFTNTCSSITPSLWSVVVHGLAPVSGTTSTPTHSASSGAAPSATLGAPSANQKSALHFSVIVGIIVAVCVLFVAVGAFLVGKKRLRVSVTRVG